MKYLAVLGRQPKISLAELESFFSDVKYMGETTQGLGRIRRGSSERDTEFFGGCGLATFETWELPDFSRFGGTLKFGEELPKGEKELVRFLLRLPEGKITLGVSDFRTGDVRAVRAEALKLKKILSREGRSVRVLENKTAVLSTATSHHNQLAEKKNHVEIMLTKFGNFKLTHVQNISDYAKRDQRRPARDAKVGMLPPKLAQILINLAGPLETGTRILDPFCGTGVVLQEAFLDGYRVFGTDLNPRMVEYTKRNLEWLLECAESKNSFSSLSDRKGSFRKSSSGENGEETDDVTDETLTKLVKCDIMKRYSDFILSEGDATEFNWGEKAKIGAVVAETYLGQPMSNPPAEIKLKQEKMTCKATILGFLKNLSGQIEADTPVVIAVPAWLRENGEYSRLNILDEIQGLGYNVVSFRNARQEDLLYHREGQIVAREIIVLRKQ